MSVNRTRRTHVPLVHDTVIALRVSALGDTSCSLLRSRFMCVLFPVVWKGPCGPVEWGGVGGLGVMCGVLYLCRVGGGGSPTPQLLSEHGQTKAVG